MEGHSLSTSSMMVTWLVPRLLVALQMYSPESCRITLGMTSWLSTIWWVQGSGARSLDQVILGWGKPAEGKAAIYLSTKTTRIENIFISRRCVLLSHAANDRSPSSSVLRSVFVPWGWHQGELPWAAQRRVAVWSATTTIRGSGTEALGAEGSRGPPSTSTSTLVSEVPSLLRAVHT